MSIEMIDIVDENDIVIDTKPRTKDIQDTAIIRWVTVIIVTSDGKIVSQQRKSTKTYAPLRFEASVGGTVIAGDDYETSAVKEMEEELGINVPLVYLGKYTAKNNERIIAHSSLHIGLSDGPFKNWEIEAERLEYFTFKELEFLVDRLPYMFSYGIKCSMPFLKDYFKENY